VFPAEAGWLVVARLLRDVAGQRTSHGWPAAAAATSRDAADERRAGIGVGATDSGVGTLAGETVATVKSARVAIVAVGGRTRGGRAYPAVDLTGETGFSTVAGHVTADGS